MPSLWLCDAWLDHRGRRTLSPNRRTRDADRRADPQVEYRALAPVAPHHPSRDVTASAAWEHDERRAADTFTTTVFRHAVATYRPASSQPVVTTGGVNR